VPAPPSPEKLLKKKETSCALLIVPDDPKRFVSTVTLKSPISSKKPDPLILPVGREEFKWQSQS
jgi:hypothetical protein